MTTRQETPQQGTWDELTDREQSIWSGNTDPWAGPVDPVAYDRWLRRHRADVTGWRAIRENDTCGCWSSDCAECGARISDGQRPTEGAVRRFVRASTVSRIASLHALRGG